MRLPKGKGRVLNHSSKELFVIENDSGKPIAHRLGPKMKSPAGVDADGFKRSDGRAILFHKEWWKVRNFLRADVFELRSDFLIPLSFVTSVGDRHFGKYTINDEKGWGEKLTYITGIIKDKKRRTIGYIIENRKRVTVAEAIRLTNAEKLDNVIVVERRGTVFLRTKKNMRIDDNLTA